MSVRVKFILMAIFAAVPLIAAALVALRSSPVTLLEFGLLALAFWSVCLTIMATSGNPAAKPAPALPVISGSELSGQEDRALLAGEIANLRAIKSALKEQNSRLHIAVRSAGAGVWDWDVLGDQVQWSDQVFEIFGIASDVPVTPELWRSHVIEEDRLLAESLMLAATESGSHFEHSFRIRRGTETRWVQAHATVVRDSHQRVIRMVGVYIDVTSRVAADDQRREVARRLQMVAQQIPGFVYQFRLNAAGDMSFPYVSAGIQSAYGCTPAQATADASILFDAVHPDDLAGVRSSILQSSLTLEPWRHEYRVKRGDGQYRWLLGSSVPEREADGGTLWHGFITDVTESRQRQEELAQAREAADAASRAKSEFLANMSHELRTPMTAILGFVDLLNDSTADPATRAEHVATIKRNSEHLITLINDILDLSKIEAGKMTIELASIDPGKSIEDVCAIMVFRARSKKIELTLENESDLPRVIRTDGLRLRQILLNLIGNAVKFTSEGSVRVSVGVDRRGSGPGELRVSVKDTGIGIDPKVLPTLFSAFQQGDSSMSRRFGGTGLGLQISKRLALLLGGDISVTSTLGEGSEFTLRLPVSEVELTDVSRASPRLRQDLASAQDATVSNGASARANDVVAQAEQRAGGVTTPLARKRILLVEDGPDNQRLISFHLTRAGATVSVVANGILALQSVEQSGTPTAPGFDLVVMDMQMPEMDGYDATRRLRLDGWRLPVLALTAHAMAGDRQKCLDAGCDEYTTKPINRDALIGICVAMAAKSEASEVSEEASVVGRDSQ
ncbi:MAG: PAS domain-containing protein [Phycisphaerales bacterium]|nr:PAS domain-containing protein [Phycisphaerales bacterium]